MLPWLDGLRDFNFYTMLLRLGLALLIGGFIGAERTKHGRSAGIRTHILVCLGAALAMMVSLYGKDVLGNEGDIFRLAAQVVSGVGFLGAGIILVRDRNRVVGLTTAAGLWTVAIVGLACGVGFYEGAVVCGILVFIVTEFLPKFERLFGKQDAGADDKNEKDE